MTLEENCSKLKKPPSETVMCCYPDDETNVIVLSPSKEGEQIENSEKEKSERTKKLLSNKFGSTFKVLPEARTTSGTGKESSGGSGGSSRVIYLLIVVLYRKSQSLW